MSIFHFACALGCLASLNAQQGHNLTLTNRSYLLDSHQSMAKLVLTNPLVRANALDGLSHDALASNKKLAATLACMVDTFGFAVFKEASWPHESIARFQIWMKENHTRKCEIDSVNAFNVAVASLFGDFSISQSELVALLGDGKTPLKGLGKNVDEYTRGGALSAFHSWTRGARSPAKQGKDLSFNPKYSTEVSHMTSWRRINFIPTGSGLLYLSTRDVLDGDLRLWAGAHRHRVLSIIDSRLVPAKKYQKWQLPDEGQSLRIDVQDKLSQEDTEVLLHALPPALAFIEKAAQDKHAVIVHCAAGRSRSVAVVLAHKMVADGSTLPEAFAHVLAQRPQAMPNTNFMKALALLDDLFAGLPKGTSRRDALVRFLQAIPKDIDGTMTSTMLEQRVPGYSANLADDYYKEFSNGQGSPIFSI